MQYFLYLHFEILKISQKQIVSVGGDVRDEPNEAKYKKTNQPDKGKQKHDKLKNKGKLMR